MLIFLPPAPSEGGGAGTGNVRFYFISILFSILAPSPLGRAGVGIYFIKPTPAVALVAASIKMKAPFDLLSV